MRGLEIADADVMRMATQQDIARSDEPRYDHRLDGLLLVSRGHSCQQVDEWCSAGQMRFEAHGMIGLRGGARSGQTATLNTK